MNSLASTTVIAGIVLAVVYAPCLVVPGRAREWIRRFPRSRRVGWLLSAAGLVWAGWIVAHASLGRFEYLKPMIYVVVPLAVFIVPFSMRELLAPRALGGLLLLAATPLLAVARWHESAARLVVVVLAYLAAVAGVCLVLSPFLFRKGMAVWIRTDARCRILGCTGLAAAALLVALGLTVL
ncbi:MAG: hypothetical protein HQ559_07120 [Lentisphaerae bacterium]|nr:hypothetical protein [Lentisphaerota bacterium]